MAVLEATKPFAIAHGLATGNRFTGSISYPSQAWRAEGRRAAGLAKLEALAEAEARAATRTRDIGDMEEDELRAFVEELKVGFA